MTKEKWDLLSKLLDLLESEEGEHHLNEYFKKIEIKRQIQERQLGTFHAKHALNIGEIVEKIVIKYSSESYKRRWYSRGIEPREDLYWFLYHYAKKYGRECNEADYAEYGNVFTRDMFRIGDYFIQKMDGQGSVIVIDKLRIINDSLVIELAAAYATKKFSQNTIDSHIAYNSFI